MAKMLGDKYRVCDAKFCTCNGAPRTRKAMRRHFKRSERQKWKREANA